MVVFFPRRLAGKTIVQALNNRLCSA